MRESNCLSGNDRHRWGTAGQLLTLLRLVTSPDLALVGSGVEALLDKSNYGGRLKVL